MDIWVDLQIASQADNIPNEADFTRWVHAALTDRKAAELSIRIVDAEESQALNRDYRGKDKPTNVLSFPFDAPAEVTDEGVDQLLGDLVICAPVVAQEAEQQEKKAHDHWAHLVIHGTLHLLGYDHIEDDQAEIMEQLERDILAQLGIADPYLGEHEV